MEGLVQCVIKVNHRVTIAIDEASWHTTNLESGSRRPRGQDGHRDGAQHRHVLLVDDAKCCCWVGGDSTSGIHTVVWYPTDL